MDKLNEGYAKGEGGGRRGENLEGSVAELVDMRFEEAYSKITSMRSNERTLFAFCTNNFKYLNVLQKKVTFQIPTRSLNHCRNGKEYSLFIKNMVRYF